MIIKHISHILILFKNPVGIKYIAFYLVPTFDDDVHRYKNIPSFN